ncbi:MAG: cytochrome b/b6 domain-containing protein, partial [Pseudomonadota bacterium]
MLSNTPTRYGLVSRTLHWAVAVLVLSALILGVIGKNIPRTAENIQLLTTLYSTHKTIGVTVLALAILRIGWALSQPRPVPLHPDRRLETFAAEAAHWVLYAALFVLPLSGWV